jgi:hypothetical protein
MPSPRLFGFRSAKKRSVDAAEEPATPDPLETLADRVFETSQELPKSTAWGMSPAEDYLQRRHNPRK